jgi:hypothetical protein
MALVIFALGTVLGWFIRPPGRAALVTTAVGVGALAVLAVLWLTGAEVSPLETIVLLFGTPIAAGLAGLASSAHAAECAGRKAGLRLPGDQPPTVTIAASRTLLAGSGWIGDRDKRPTRGPHTGTSMGASDPTRRGATAG